MFPVQWNAGFSPLLCSLPLKFACDSNLVEPVCRFECANVGNRRVDLFKKPLWCAEVARIDGLEEVV